MVSIFYPVDLKLKDSRPRVPEDWRDQFVKILDKLLVKISGTNNVDILEINSLISACSRSIGTTESACLRIMALKKATLLGNGKMKKSSLMNSCLISIFFSFSQLQREPVLADVSSPYRMFTDMLKMANWWNLLPNPTEGQIFSHFIEVNNRLMAEDPFSNGIDINDLFRGLFLGRPDVIVPTKNNILFGVWNRAYQHYSDFFEVSGFYSGVKENPPVHVDEPASSGESSGSTSGESSEMVTDPIAVITDEEMVF